MRRYLVEDAAHDAVLKILGISKLEIQICNGEGKVISETLKHENCIGIIDKDNGITHSKLAQAIWHEEDDFEYTVVNDRLFICFDRDIEHWLIRASVELKVNLADFSLPDNSKELHWKITSRSFNARRFLEQLRNADGSPLVLLRDLIKNRLPRLS